MVGGLPERLVWIIDCVLPGGFRSDRFTLPHPVLGPLDAYQWILRISAHSESHTKQIEEVKADPSFPKE